MVMMMEMEDEIVKLQHITNLIMIWIWILDIQIQIKISMAITFETLSVHLDSNLGDHQNFEQFLIVNLQDPDEI